MHLNKSINRCFESFMLHEASKSFLIHITDHFLISFTFREWQKRFQFLTFFSKIVLLEVLMRSLNSRQQAAAVQISIDKKSRNSYKPYYVQSNVSIIRRQSPDHSPKMYQILLNTLADPYKSLDQLFCVFYSSIFQAPPQSIHRELQANQLAINKLYLFAIDCFLLHCKIKKDTGCDPNLNMGSLLQELVNKENLKSGQLLMKWVENRLKIYVKEALSKIERLKLEDDINFNINEFPHSFEKDRSKWKVQQIYSVYLKLKRNFMQQVLNLGDQRKRIYIPCQYFGEQQLQILYLDQILKTLFQLPLAPRANKISKLEIFINKSYRNYFRGSFVKERQRHVDKKKFVISRYTNNDRLQFLINLGDLVKLRKNEAGIRKENFQIARAIIVELNRHKKITSLTYPLLTPQSILFNQLSLKVQLSSQNIINSTLGLNFKPMSIQQRIGFDPTPQPFDSFNAPFQYQQVNRLKMYHFYHLCKEAQNQKKAQADMRAQSQAFEVNRLLQKSEFWRCLLTISYFLNGRQFYDQKFGNPKIRANRLNFAQVTYSLLVTDQYFYKQICGDQFIEWLTRHSQPKYEQNRQSQFLEQLLRPQTQYSVIKNQLQSVNIKNYINVMQDTVNLLIKTLEGQSKFKKFQNSIKYLVRFYAYILLSFSLLSIIFQKYSKIDMEKAVVFQRVFKTALNINKAEQRQPNILDKTIIQFKKYQARNIQIAQIMPNYMQEYLKMQDLYQKYKSFRDKLSYTESIYEQHRNVKKLTEFYDKNMSPDGEIIFQEIAYIKKTLKKIIYKQFLNILNEEHHEHKSTSESVSKFKKMKITLILQILLKIDLKSLQFIQSMMIPIMFTEIPGSLNNNGLIQFCDKNSQLMSYLLQVLQQMKQQ